MLKNFFINAIRNMQKRLAIGWLSIMSQALKAAAYNPAESLRYK